MATYTKTPEDYGKEYQIARATGDATAMKAANDAANAVRIANGLAPNYANEDIALIASQNAGNKVAKTAQSLNTGGVTNTTPVLGGLELGDKLGINYDFGSIQSILNNATGASYDAQRAQQKTTENTFYNNMANTQSASLDMLRKSQAAAVATGASKGMAAADELSSVLNLQNVSSIEANNLANANNLLSSQQQAATAKNAQTAMDTSNSLKTAIGGMDLTKYGYDVQQSVGIMDYLANLAQTAGSVEASKDTLSGVKYNADQNLTGSQYTADQNLAGTQYNADYGYGGSKNANYGNTASGGGGYTPSGSNNNPTSDTTGAASTSSGSDVGSPISLTFSNDTLIKQADGTYSLSTTDPSTGKPTRINGISEVDKTAIIMEGDSNVLDKGYAASVMNMPSVTNGDRIAVGGNTYTYSSIKHLWISSGGTAWGSKNLKMMQDRLAKQATPNGSGKPATVDSKTGVVTLPSGQTIDLP